MGNRSENRRLNHLSTEKNSHQLVFDNLYRSSALQNKRAATGALALRGMFCATRTPSNVFSLRPFSAESGSDSKFEARSIIESR